MAETSISSAWKRHALLSVAEMYAADKAAIAGGVPGATLMDNAGRAIAREILMRWKARPTLVLCGPGNNGGDGFVVARELVAAGWPVHLALLGEVGRLKGDAAWAAGTWTGAIEPLDPGRAAGAGLVVDALFGAGLDRPIEGPAREMIETVAKADTRVVAVDVPSGVSGDSGAVLGVTAPADVTVTFFRPKTGHLMYPGRGLCGDLVVADIGIPETVLDTLKPAQVRNRPPVWRGRLHDAAPGDHKYSRGHPGVVAGPMTGAARLAATAAYRAGAGMVTVLCPAPFETAFAAAPAALVLAETASPDALPEASASRRLSALAVGPGLGRSPSSTAWVEAALGTGLPIVVDADGLSAFADNPRRLFAALEGRAAVLTPHEGEFGRLFDLPGDKLSRARAAAAQSGAVVLLKGADTVVAAPDGRAAINDNAPSWLATAGAGDVLSGTIAALLAQGTPPFEAACAGAWLTGDAAARLGPGMIADDLAAALWESRARLVSRA